jgi:hypothetical protein
MQQYRAARLLIVGNSPYLEVHTSCASTFQPNNLVSQQKRMGARSHGRAFVTECGPFL